MAGEIPFLAPVPDYRSVVPGVWSDILNAWILSFRVTENGVEGSSITVSQNASITNLDELENTFEIALIDLTSTMNEVRKQMELLNLRFEEAFDTGISRGDIDID